MTDFSHQTLHGFDFTAAELSGSNFSFTDLSPVRDTSPVPHTDGLIRADFTRANCSGADFSAATARGVLFCDTDLRGAIFRDADLTGAVFIDADLSGADLRGALLLGTELEDATLEGTLTDPDATPEAVVRS